MTNKHDVTYRLDSEVVEWINNEAIDNNMTPDAVVESLVYTMKCMYDCNDIL